MKIKINPDACELFYESMCIKKERADELNEKIFESLKVPDINVAEVIRDIGEMSVNSNELAYSCYMLRDMLQTLAQKFYKSTNESKIKSIN